ncbi:TetR/AcrR family transcriptional regulator [Marispirochaeta aestuarii]|uniref:TetR/AcrR family transcriptional regulator n=1 Tax=Marispirochaeta aestuarii TaxID=1963862 RepID=UPI0029C923E0|nr:TetR/AcrR family transcriptional regulator [Marispirochaeta aestuarii]
MDKPVDKGTEQQILQAAHRVIVRRGKSGTRMQEIADEAGVNKALLHYYFRSKDKIYHAILRNVASELFRSLLDSLDFSLPFYQLISDFIRLHIGAIRNNLDLFQFFFSEIWTNRAEVLPVFLEVLSVSEGRLPELFFARVNRAVYEKEIRPVDPLNLLLNIISLDVFFFVASPLIIELMELPESELQRMFDERALQVTDFVWESIKYRGEQ